MIKKLIYNFFYDIYVDLFVAFIFIYFALIDYKVGFLSILGIALILLSLPLWILARFQLGKSFALRPIAKNFVHSGLYSKIRHPMYLFSSITAFGIMLILNHWYWYLLFFILIVVQIFRATKEDHALEKTFGQGYFDYKRKTWF
ncbi:MAG: methyltransferase [Candidatus Berkelbacteria bacterium]